MFLLHIIHSPSHNIECSNYQGIPMISTAHKMLSTLLLSRLFPYAHKITGGWSVWILT